MRNVEVQKPIVLIVDTSIENRVLIRETFSENYLVEEAGNAEEAIRKLKYKKYAAVIVDAEASEAEGYELLKTMKKELETSVIPVVVIAEREDVEGQIKALDMGAVDVIVKPVEPRVLLHKIRNILARNEAIYPMGEDMLQKVQLEQQELLRSVELDEKTGIYNRQTFCRYTQRMIRENKNCKYVIVRWEIDRFKAYNDIYGIAAGDRYLAAVGGFFRTCRNMTYAHLEADHFVFCMKDVEFLIEEMIDRIEDWLKQYDPGFEFVSRFGIYQIEDGELDVGLMCDRALLALNSVKKSFTERIAWYNESMRSELLEEQKIVSEMEGALSSSQFQIYLQPQYNHVKETMVGAEILVRWFHPERGMVSPGKFIPVFERNGLITKLDEYVWEQACALMRKWEEKGLPSVPLSVNISRVDIYNPNLTEIFRKLIEKYRLKPSQLRLEITETAYMENSEQLIDVVKKFQKMGFCVEMDDFGSGYSSLNTLKDVPVDILKLDMKFLENRKIHDRRSRIILDSVVHMAHWLELPVIAEGVETEFQANYLKNIGCELIQGYFYGKPMPVEEFEQLLIESPLGDLNVGSI